MAIRKAASAGNGTVTTTPRTRPSGLQPVTAPSRVPKRSARRLVVTADRKPGKRKALQTGCRLAATEPLHEHLQARIMGQNGAIDALVCSWARLLSGLRDPSRPLLTALFLGPTGVGKTETAKALAEALFGSADALTRIDCEEYAHGHEVAKLLGSPPGYVGADIEPLLSQQRIDKAHWKLRQEYRVDPETSPALIEQVHNPEHKLCSIVLFDEIEKAHPTLWNALLGILDDGRVTLGNNRTTDLTRSIILMTSNVGSREMSAALERRTVGFLEAGSDHDSADGGATQRIARAAAREVFPIEFLNRFDEVLVYAPLEREHLEAIFHKFLDQIAQRAMDFAGIPLLIRVTETAKDFIIAQGTDPRLGARPLRRAMERLLVDPLSRLIASQQVTEGDVVEVELETTELVFYRLPRNARTIVA